LFVCLKIKTYLCKPKSSFKEEYLHLVVLLSEHFRKRLFLKNCIKAERSFILNRMKRITIAKNSRFQPEIAISRFGRVDDQKVNHIVSVMRECYSRLAPHKVDVTDLYVFERSSAVEAFLAEESKRLGVASSPFNGLFFSLHDAWRGIPRIIICLERMKKLSPLAQKGGIRHEVGHSVLHGSPFYYILTFPPALRGLAKRFKLSQQYVINMLYLISIAVKDYEVSRLLHKHDYVKDQIAFAKHILTPTESDKMTWEISRAKPEAQALCLTSYLKLIGYTTPFLTDENSGERLYRYLRESLSFLPRNYSRNLLEQAPKMFQKLNLDTMNNLNRFTQLIVEKIIEPLFADAAERKEKRGICREI